MKSLVPIEVIEQRIFFMRSEKVMIDRDLAELYQVSTKNLNQAVKRNIDRFPEGFMFRLTKTERNELVTNCDRFRKLKHSTHYPLAFTEQGVAMLSSVLRSKRAIHVNIQIISTFVRLRRMFSDNKELARGLAELEKKYDAQFRVVFSALKQILIPKQKPNRPIGFQIREAITQYSTTR